MTTPQTQAQIMEADGFLKACTAAELVGVNIATVYRMVEDGRVKGSRIGRAWYVDGRSLALHYVEAPPIFDRIKGALPEKVQTAMSAPIAPTPVAEAANG